MTNADGVSERRLIKNTLVRRDAPARSSHSADNDFVASDLAPEELDHGTYTMQQNDAS